MAEAQLDPESDLASSFQRAADHLQSLVSKLDSNTLLKLYGLYKQATVGPCDCSQPGWFRAQARHKWDAWNSLKDMPITTAMQTYVETMDSLDPNWDSDETASAKSPGWVTVSSMMKEDDIDENEKTIYDYVKEGDVSKVAELFENNLETYGGLDDSEMGLIHWAADRGSLPMMKYIVTQMNADVNMKDGSGQTALHYAASCGHADIVKYLLENKADLTARDAVDNSTPLQVACDDGIAALLRDAQ